ncbi:MAG: response regulator [Ignavibacteriales bacterium]|nr:MAG: response regulator [Ignavibacteriales bacterium]
MALFILAIVIFVIADILIRMVGRKMQEKKVKLERENVLQESLKLDFSKEAKTLKRAEVENPKARILCVDDEEVILGSFRKILVLDGYSVDTVETGQEALGLIQKHHYDFVFTDLKMPEMSGVDVTKSVKHMRPDIDVIIITGYASVETAVECMKYGAMDYVQKPFTEDELLEFVKKTLIKRQDRIEKLLKPKVHISHLPEAEYFHKAEFAIPGGVFISKNHCWVSMDQDGSAKIGIDDFAKKLVGKIDDIELPNLGMNVKTGQPLFTVRQNNKSITFSSPVSGQVSSVNLLLKEDLESLDTTPYERNWFCVIDAENMDSEISSLKIGKAAVSFFQEDIESFRSQVSKILKQKNQDYPDKPTDDLYVGVLENFDDGDWDKVTEQFFKR